MKIQISIFSLIEKNKKYQFKIETQYDMESDIQFKLVNDNDNDIKYLTVYKKFKFFPYATKVIYAEYELESSFIKHLIENKSYKMIIHSTTRIDDIEQYNI